MLLDYVGLPRAVEFGKQFDTIFIHINAARVAELRDDRDSALEVEPELLLQATRLRYSAQATLVVFASVLAQLAPQGSDHPSTQK